jgi:hypothetical protein
MKCFLFFFVTILAGCSSGSNPSNLIARQKISKDQLILSQMKDSLISDYSTAKSQQEKQNILGQYHLKLQTYLISHSMDSLRVTIDEVSVNDRTIRTKAHYGDIQFEYSLTFGSKMSPKLDSLYEFMKGLVKGSDTSANFSFTGACQVNNPDSAKLPTFRIYAFPMPLQFTGR